MSKDYGREPTNRESFLDGLQTGLLWKDKCDWVPGGPHVYTAHGRKDPDWVAFCERSRKANQEWLRGWHLGNNRRKDMQPKGKRRLREFEAAVEHHMNCIETGSAKDVKEAAADRDKKFARLVEYIEELEENQK